MKSRYKIWCSSVSIKADHIYLLASSVTERGFCELSRSRGTKRDVPPVICWPQGTSRTCWMHYTPELVRKHGRVVENMEEERGKKTLWVARVDWRTRSEADALRFLTVEWRRELKMDDSLWGCALIKLNCTEQEMDTSILALLLGFFSVWRWFCAVRFLAENPGRLGQRPQNTSHMAPRSHMAAAKHTHNNRGRLRCVLMSSQPCGL